MWHSFIQVFSRKDPYDGEEFTSTIHKVCDPNVNKRPPVPKSMPPEVSSLLYTSCLDVDPSVRPTFTELDVFLKRFQAENVAPGEQSNNGQRTRRKSLESARRLLDEIFPPHVAAALREGRKVEPEHFDCVSKLWQHTLISFQYWFKYANPYCHIYLQTQQFSSLT